jgi:uncharacterized membrane protein
MNAEMIVLRLVHVMSGIFWVGTAGFMTFFLGPAMITAGPAAGPVMAGLRARKLLVALPAFAVLTMLSGLRLMWIVSGGSFGAYASSRTGGVFTLGAASAVLAFVIGMAVSRPAAMKAAALAASMAGAQDFESKTAISRELAAVQKKSDVGTKIVMVFLIIAAGAMAIARYLG